MFKHWFVALLAVVLIFSLPADAWGKKDKGEKGGKLLGNGSAAAAQSGVAPQSQVVEPVSIPADPTLPTFYLTVEPPFMVAAQGIVSGGGVTPGAPQQSTFTSPWFNAALTHNPQSLSPSASPDQRLGYGAAAQLVTALMSIGNVAVIDHETYKANSAKYPEIFVVKGTVTEYTETNQLDEQKKGVSSGVFGSIVNLVGGATGNSAVANVGAGIAMINAGKQTVTTTRTGMVGLSLQVVKAENGQIIGAPVAKGTFVTQSATQIKHGLGIENSQAEYQTSALDQAGQAALNDATTKIWEVLKRQATSQVAVALPAEK